MDDYQEPPTDHPYYLPSYNPQTRLLDKPSLDNDDGADCAVPSNEKGSYQPPPYVARPDQQQNKFAYGGHQSPSSLNPPHHGPPAAVQQYSNSGYQPAGQFHHQVQQNNPRYHHGPPPPPQNNPPYGQSPHQIQPNNPYHGPPPPLPNNPYNGYQYNGLPPPVQQGYGPINHMSALVAGPGVTEAPKPRIEEVKTNIRLSLFCCIGWILLCALPAIPFGICALAFSYSSVRLRKKEKFDESIKRGRYAKYASIIAGVIGGVWGITFLILFLCALLGYSFYLQVLQPTSST